jgi:ABC-type transport system substrate-binding protein
LVPKGYFDHTEEGLPRYEFDLKKAKEILAEAGYPTNQFHSAGFSPGTNLMRYNRLDREIDEARSERDPQRRLKLYREIQRKLIEDLPAVPLFMVQSLCYQRPYVVGLPERAPVWGIDLYPIHFADGKWIRCGQNCGDDEKSFPT